MEIALKLDRHYGRPAGELAASELVALLASRLDVADGEWTLEIIVSQGRLRRLYRKQGPLGEDEADGIRPVRPLT